MYMGEHRGCSEQNQRGLLCHKQREVVSFTSTEELINLGKGNRPLGALILSTSDQTMSTLASPKCQWACQGEGDGGDEDTQMEMIVV